MRTIIGARGRMGRVGKVVFLLLVPFAAAVAPTTVDAQTCGLSAGGTLANVINSYYPGVGTAAAGATSISVGTIDPNGATTRHRVRRPPPRHPDAGRRHQHHERDDLRLRHRQRARRHRPQQRRPVRIRGGQQRGRGWSRPDSRQRQRRREQRPRQHLPLRRRDGHGGQADLPGHPRPHVPHRDPEQHLDVVPLGRGHGRRSGLRGRRGLDPERRHREPRRPRVPWRGRTRAGWGCHRHVGDRLRQHDGQCRPRRQGRRHRGHSSLGVRQRHERRRRHRRRGLPRRQHGARRPRQRGRRRHRSERRLQRRKRGRRRRRQRWRRRPRRQLLEQQPAPGRHRRRRPRPW